MVLSEEDLKKEIKTFTECESSSSVKSSEFQQFRKELIPAHHNIYEKVCNFCGNILAIKADPKKHDKIKEALEICHINTTPEGVTAFSILFPLAVMILGVLFSFLISTFFMEGQSLLFFVFIFLLGGLSLIIPLSTLPLVLANNWRLRASNQMVMSIFYIVSYMRHTSNLELAIKFTSDHIAPPLSLDYRKIVWNVESGKFDDMKASLENYLLSWKENNPGFVECMHMIESSLYEKTEKRRINTLEKSLSLILESTYENMLHFAQNLKSPITMLHMLGVILPILGLVILPLVVSFMNGAEWYHIAVLYNLFLPLLVWYLSKTILSTRPTGYGQADITEVNPELLKYTNFNLNLGKKKISIDPKWISFLIMFIFLIIGTSPLIIHKIHTARDITWDFIYHDLKFKSSNDFEEIQGATFAFLGYKESMEEGNEGKIVGPYGLGATLISIAVPFGAAIAVGFYFRTKTKKIIKIRNKTRQLEKEFASALFQLGNRIGNGLPAEIAFSKVTETMDESLSGKFFELVSSNITTLGMGVEDAIFDKKHGAINKFPSALIESSMKVFVESSKKGPDTASESLINISTYIKEMHRVDERLKDLMAEITSSMKSQINFLAPLISGIVIGLTSMITSVLTTLGFQTTQFSAESSGGGATASIPELFGDGVPTFFFQIVVGIYVVQITYLLTQMLNTIQSGYDPLNEKYLIGQYVKKSGILYTTIAFVVILMFNIIAGTVVANML